MMEREFDCVMTDGIVSVTEGGWQGCQSGANGQRSIAGQMIYEDVDEGENAT